MKNSTPLILAVTLSVLAGHALAQAPNTTTTTTTTLKPVTTAEVGVSSRDGITVSGSDVLVTRNGVTEKLLKEVEFPNGLRMQPDGTLLTRDGGKMTLRPSQVLSFDGAIIDAPIIESVAPRTPMIAVPVVPATTVPITPAKTKEAADEAARVEAERRATSINKGPIKAGEGVQK